MNKRTIITSLAIFGILAGGAGFAQAYNGHGMGYGMGDGQGIGCGYYHERGHFADCPYADGSGRGYYGYAKQGKQLTDEQIAAIETLQAKHFDTMQSLGKEFRQKQRELNALKYNSNTDTEDLQKILADMNAIENKMYAERQNFASVMQNEYGIELKNGYGMRRGKMHRSCY